MAGVADLLIRMAMDSRGVTQGADQVEGKLSGVAKKGTAAFQALAAGGIGFAAVQLFQLGVEAESWQRKFDTVFGEAGGIVAEWADQFNERFGQSEERLRGVAAGVGDLLVPLGLTRTEAANTSTEVLELAAALSEWKGGAISVEETTNILTRAVLGERDALIGLGVKISEEEVKTRLLEKGMQDLTGAALGQAKAMVTLELITERSADAMTAFASGGSEALLAQNALKAAIDTLKVTLGEAVTALAPLISGFADLLGVLGKVDGLLPGVAAGIAALALGLGPLGALFVAIGVAAMSSGDAMSLADIIAMNMAADLKTVGLGFKQAADAVAVFEAKLAAARAEGGTFMGWAATVTVPDSFLSVGEKPLDAQSVDRISLSIQLAAARAAEDAAESARVAAAEDAFGASLAAGFSEALLANQGDLTKAIEDLVAAAENQTKVSAQMRIMAQVGLGEFAEGLTGSPEEIAAALDVMVGEAGSLSNMLQIAEALGDNTSAAYIRGLMIDAARMQGTVDAYRNAGITLGGVTRDGIIVGLDGLAALLQRELTVEMKAGIAGAKNAIWATSPSRYVAQQLGIPIAEGVIAGIIEREGGIGQALLHAVQAGLLTAEQAIGLYVGVGQRLGSGIEQGLLSSTGPVSQAMSQVVRTASDNAIALIQEFTSAAFALSSSGFVAPSSGVRHEGAGDLSDLAGQMRLSGINSLTNLVAAGQELTGFGIDVNRDTTQALRALGFSSIGEIVRYLNQQYSLTNLSQVEDLARVSGDPAIQAMAELLRAATQVTSVFTEQIGPSLGIFNLSQLPQFAGGGVVPGPFGAPVPVLAHGGESISPAGRGDAPSVVINVGGSIISNRELLSYVRQGLREYAQTGGSLQL